MKTKRTDATTSERKRILSVTIKHTIDADPDTSYLGEYSGRATSDFSIDRRERGDAGRNEFQYFNPSFNYVDKNGKPTDNLTPEEVTAYTEQDYQRMEALNNCGWHYLGISATAEVQLTGDLTQKVRSGGLWGIESDSDKSYFAEVESDELANLKTELHAMGFSKRAITAAFRDVQRSDD
jgi:hypothetical protein